LGSSSIRAHWAYARSTGAFTMIDRRAALSGADFDCDGRIASSDGEAPILLLRENAAPPVGEIKRPHVEHEHPVVTSPGTPPGGAQ